jgi:twitching motility protein PilT
MIMPDYYQELKQLLKIAVQEKASDLHFSVGHPPTLRVSRRLIPLMKFDLLTSEDTKGIAFALLNDEQKERFLKRKEIDFSYKFESNIRFRVNTFFQKGNISVSMRLIPGKIRTIEELNLPPVLHEFAKASQGFVLIAGPSSHGKSTTLAALVDEVNHLKPVHIITIEDPIEYYFKDDRAIIDQREIGIDTLSFSRALRSTFRQDPDVIMVGEMRDPETIATAITAAETGHLVFSTLHTNDAAQTIHRIVDSFPPAQQGQIRAQLSGSLLGVISQRLTPRIKGGLIPACEIMISTPAVANLIRENKIHEIPMVIETSAEMGMITLNKSLANLVRAKEISMRTSLEYSLNPVELRRLIGRIG